MIYFGRVTLSMLSLINICNVRISRWLIFFAHFSIFYFFNEFFCKPTKIGFLLQNPATTALSSLRSFKHLNPKKVEKVA